MQTAFRTVGPSARLAVLLKHAVAHKRRVGATINLLKGATVSTRRTSGSPTVLFGGDTIVSGPGAAGLTAGGPFPGRLLVSHVEAMVVPVAQIHSAPKCFDIDHAAVRPRSRPIPNGSPCPEHHHAMPDLQFIASILHGIQRGLSHDIPAQNILLVLPGLFHYAVHV